MSRKSNTFFTGPQRGNVAIGSTHDMTIVPHNARALRSSIDTMKQQVARSQKDVHQHLGKLKKSQEFNTVLSKAYLANLKTLVDTTKLLKELQGVMTAIVGSLDYVANELSGVNANDLQRLEELTGKHVLDIQQNLKKDIANVKAIYDMFAKDDAFSDLEKSTILNDDTLKQAMDLKTELRQVGGARRKSARPKQKQLKHKTY
jgi:hypothetical protein